MNFQAAPARPSPPQRAMRKYIGMRTISKARKNRIRSRTAKVARVPDSRTSSRATKAFGDGPADGLKYEERALRKVSRAVRPSRGREMPAVPRWSRTSNAGHELV